MDFKSTKLNAKVVIKIVTLRETNVATVNGPLEDVLPT